MRIVEMDLPDDMIGVYAISAVDEPAIEENFIALSKQGKKSQYALAKIDEEKRLLIGAALIPNKQIYRQEEGTDGYYMYFPKSVVYKAAHNFLINGMQSNHTVQHDKKVEGLTVVESWLIEDEKQDKAYKYGFDLPVGTWMMAVKVNNDEVWQEVKAGKLKGFSIEAYFAEKMTMKSEVTEKDVLQELQSVISKIDKIANQ